METGDDDVQYFCRVVILFLLITPFAFVAALMFAFGVHKIAQGNGADKNIILGFAMMRKKKK